MISTGRSSMRSGIRPLREDPSSGSSGPRLPRALWSPSGTNEHGRSFKRLYPKSRSGPWINTASCSERITTMTEETLTRIRQHLETLKLLGIQKVLDQELSYAAQQALPPTELFERLLAIEAKARIERRNEERIKETRLPERKLRPVFDVHV